MMVVRKSCSNCYGFDHLVYIPKDMLNDTFECPLCGKGKVRYEKVWELKK
jgi:rubredoxin